MRGRFETPRLIHLTMPSTKTSATATSTTALAGALRDHFTNVVLPLWRGPGFNAGLKLPYEAVSADDHRPLPAERYRAMACARQLFVFSQAGDAAHAQVLFDSLMHTFQDTRHGGWFYSVDAQGAPLDTTKDLYTHAFIVFACAQYGRRSGNRDALEVVHRTSALIQSNFLAEDDLFNAALTADFAGVSGTPIQNPLMHLTEAWLAARESTRDNAFDAALHRLAGAVARHFVHAPTGCIAELPIGADDNRLEPGHQFEWYWLVKQAPDLFEASGLDEALARAFAFAQQCGVDPQTGACTHRSTKPARSRTRPSASGLKRNTCARWQVMTTQPRSPRCRGKSSCSSNASCVRRAGSSARRRPGRWRAPTCRRPRRITSQPPTRRYRTEQSRSDQAAGTRAAARQSISTLRAATVPRSRRRI